jgi:ABC-2 type transport system permease protein
MMSTVAREINAVVAIAARDIIRFTKSPGEMIANIIYPIIFLGILGGSLSQNLGGSVGYNFLQFVMIGTIVFNVFSGTVGGMASLTVEREMNLTQELYVSPISRYTIILGKMIGSGVGSIASVIGVLIVALLMQIPFDGVQIARLILVIPSFCLVGASLGVFFIGFVQDPKATSVGIMAIVMPQMFLSGAIIPISHSSGILDFLAKIMPLTYLVDLARGVFYWGEPVYDQVVLHHPLFNATVMSVFFLIFSIVGTIMFTRAERNR